MSLYHWSHRRGKGDEQANCEEPNSVSKEVVSVGIHGFWIGSDENLRLDVKERGNHQRPSEANTSPLGGGLEPTPLPESDNREEGLGDPEKVNRVDAISLGCRRNPSQQTRNCE